jgi:hypothetical protein
MELISYRSFGDELQKISAVSLDADTRANMAARKGAQIGVNYLPGGELPSNDPAQTNFVPKIASTVDETYKKYREPGKHALKGAIPGALLGNILGPTKMGKNPLRAGALIGAGLGLTDWIASGKARKWKKKHAMIGSQTFTPGRALSQSRAVGSFQDKVIHKGDRLRPLKLGQKFGLPSEPTQ